MSLIKAQDFNVGGGGPIAPDRIWFWSTFRQNMLDQGNGMYFNLNTGDPTKWTYEPSAPSLDDTRLWQFTTRVTWQASEKNKFTATYDSSVRQVGYKGGGGGGTGARVSRQRRHLLRAGGVKQVGRAAAEPATGDVPARAVGPDADRRGVLLV